MRSGTRLADGCPGCDRRWDAPGSEGQCSRCRRCLDCCNKDVVPYACAWKAARSRARDPGWERRSVAAYARWERDPRVLAHNRRIV